MARIVFPTTISGWFTLFTNVFTADAADANHTLQLFLDEEGISMTTDDTAMSDAQTADTNQGIYEREADKQFKIRDGIFNIVFKDHRACVQFLKKLFRLNPHKLGDWSVTVDGDGKIVYPVEFVDKCKAMQLFIAKHLSYSPINTSPLYPFVNENNIDLAINNAKIDDATTANDTAINNANKKETETQSRNNLMAPVISHLRGEGGYLVDLFGTNPNKAGDWGFRIDTSKRAAVTRTIILLPNEEKTLNNVKLDSVLANIGATTVQIAKGETLSDPISQILSNESFFISRGYGKCTVKNTSNTTQAKIQVEFNA